MAYLLKAKKNIEVQDVNEFKAKKERVRMYSITNDTNTRKILLSAGNKSRL